MNTVGGMGPYWGMHLFWWAFWIFAMVSMFGYNVPERTRINSLDPHLILRRRFAKGEISEEEYQKIEAQLLVDEKSGERNLATPIAHTTVLAHPIADGLSFTATWVILYSICSVLYWIAPDAMVTATSKLFHGMSFTQMAQTGTVFRFADFISVLTLGAVYTFVAGIVWSLIHTYFLGQRAARRLERPERDKGQRARMNPRINPQMN